jgi:hypothetical protein
LQKIIFRGQVYSSVDEMPAEARQAYQSAMAALNARRPRAAEATGDLGMVDAERARRMVWGLLFLLLGAVAVGVIFLAIRLMWVPW